MNKHYDELDSLRGLAALSVLFGHFLSVYWVMSISQYTPGNLFEQAIYFFKYSPLHIFWGGHEAVIFFFMLSGFVLTLPFVKEVKGSYKGFLIKRFFRIYIPYLVALLFAILLRVIFSKGGIKNLTYWFNIQWTSEITIKSILTHVTLLGYFDSNAYDGTVWSLVHEMRISIIFPLIASCVIMRKKWIALFVSFLISFAGFKLFNVYQPEYMTNVFYTLHYTAIFIVGGLLARDIENIVKWLKNTATYVKGVMLFLGVFSYTYNWSILSHNLQLHNFFINDWFIVFGALIFILLALSSGTISSFLKLRLIILIGRMSYSIYLYHVPILFAFIYAFYSILPLWSILLMALPVTFIVSYLSYKHVELNSINLGKHVIKKYISYRK